MQNDTTYVPRLRMTRRIDQSHHYRSIPDTDIRMPRLTYPYSTHIDIRTDTGKLREVEIRIEYLTLYRYLFHDNALSAYRALLALMLHTARRTME